LRKAARCAVSGSVGRSYKYDNRGEEKLDVQEEQIGLLLSTMD
jgi:hypothetical protein